MRYKKTEKREVIKLDGMDMRIMELSTKGFCCTQILACLAMDIMGRENPDLLRALNGFCGGIGNTEGLCGALSGGVAFLGLYCGKGADQEEPCLELDPMVRDLKAWFLERWGSLDCSDLVRKEGEKQGGICPEIMAETARRCIFLLESKGINPEHGR